MDNHAITGSDPVPEFALTRTRRLFIRPRNGLWVLEDEHDEVGGLFTTYDSAATYARREQLHASRGIRCIVIVEGRREVPLRAA